MPVDRHNADWNAPLRERLGRMLVDGLPYSQIAVVLGTTRNAISGLIYRDAELKKLVKKRPSPAQRKPRTQQPKPKPATPQPKAEPPKSFLKPEPPVPPAITPPDAKLPPMAMVPLPDLAALDCHFPVAEDASVIGGH